MRCLHKLVVILQDECCARGVTVTVTVLSYTSSPTQVHEHSSENAAKAKKRARLELQELQAKLDELLPSRDHALEQTQGALPKASCAAEANEQSQREIAELHAKLEARETELAVFRLLAATENGCDKCKGEANTYRAQITTGLVNTDEDQVVHRLMERMQAMEAEIASLRWSEKSFERVSQ